MVCYVMLSYVVRWWAWEKEWWGNGEGMVGEWWEEESVGRWIDEVGGGWISE